MFPEVITSGMIGCFLDLDHFIAARSISYSAATNLQQRPFGHAVIFVASVFVFALILMPKTPKYSVLIGSAIFTHLLRDGMKRGLWMYPFGSTYIIPPYLYIITIYFYAHFNILAIKFVSGRSNSVPINKNSDSASFDI
jgi:hypothetical protein